jgi:hypothetical protein
MSELRSSSSLIYPDAPGFRVSGPSEQAAKAIAPIAKTLRDLVRQTIAASPGGLTADEVAVALNRSVLSIRPRVSELHRNGEIQQTDRRGTNESGLTATIWVISPSIASDQDGGAA